MRFKNVSLVKDYYRLYGIIHYLSITNRDKSEKKCFCNNAGISKEELINWFSVQLEQDLKKEHINYFWGFTHDNFISFLKSSDLFVGKIFLINRRNDLNSVYQEWVTNDCTDECECSDNCYIKKISEKYYNDKKPEFLVFCCNKEFAQKHTWVLKILTYIDRRFNS